MADRDSMEPASLAVIIATLTAAAIGGYREGINRRTTEPPDLERIGNQQYQIQAQLNELATLRNDLVRGEQQYQDRLMQIFDSKRHDEANILIAAIQAEASMAMVNVSSVQNTIELRKLADQMYTAADNMDPRFLPFAQQESGSVGDVRAGLRETFGGTGPVGHANRMSAEATALVNNNDSAVQATLTAFRTNQDTINLLRISGGQPEVDIAGSVTTNTEFQPWDRFIQEEFRQMSESAETLHTSNTTEGDQRARIRAYIAGRQESVSMMNQTFAELETKMNLPEGFILANPEFQQLVENRADLIFQETFGVTSEELDAYNTEVQASTDALMESVRQKRERAAEIEDQSGGGSSGRVMTMLLEALEASPEEQQQKMQEWHDMWTNMRGTDEIGLQDQIQRIQTRERSLEAQYDVLEYEKQDQDALAVWKRSAVESAWMSNPQNPNARVNVYEDIKQALGFESDLQMALYFNGHRRDDRWNKALRAAGNGLVGNPANSVALQRHTATELSVEHGWWRAEQQASRYPDRGTPAARFARESDAEAAEQIFQQDSAGVPTEGPRYLTDILPERQQTPEGSELDLPEADELDDLPEAGLIPPPPVQQPVSTIEEEQRSAWEGPAYHRLPVPEAEAAPSDGTPKRSDVDKEMDILDKAMKNIQSLREARMSRKQSEQKHRAHRGDIAKRAARQLVPES